jgi:hypothetical protein
MSDNSSLMAKIRALLAKAESSTFEHEAAAYLAKAEELMVKHDLDRADLTPEEREQYECVTVTIGSGTPDHILWNVVAKVRGVKFIRETNHRGDGKTRPGYLIGYRVDIEFVQTLVTSLMLQRERFLINESVPTWEGVRAFRHSYRVGYANRIYARMKATQAETVKASGPGNELVLLDKFALVERHANELFTNLTPGRSVRSSSNAGYRAGQSAANRADVSGGRNNVRGGSRAALAR